MTPAGRIRSLTDRPVRADAEYVVYWMTAYRRLGWNFALDRAVEWCRRLKRPLLVFEPLGCGHRWASARLHRFVIDGMRDKARALRRPKGVRYFPYVEPSPGAGRGLLEALAARACVVVSDDYPCFFLPRMVHAAAQRLPVRLELIDGNGLLPLRAADRVFARAYDFRRFLQRELPAHLDLFPASEPLKGPRLPPFAGLPEGVVTRWPAANLAHLTKASGLADLPIDHTVRAVERRGGPAAAAARLAAFLDRDLPRYADDRNHPDRDAASGLSPYLHFGHVSTHQILAGLAAREGWSAEAVTAGGKGERSGWWGMSPSAEAVLDQLVTWRELGFNMAWQREDHDRYSSLPVWARSTLEDHAGDLREHVYDLQTFEAAATHDALWNAAQTQLLCEGRIHNYLRMLWGKKIFEWSPTPEAALDVMIELNNKHALDGRDPNSYSGIFWCLGRYDRAWGPERPIYGKVRYMTSASTRRKLRLKEYLVRYAPAASTA